ncbi:MAG: hypothetical protein WAV54_03215 [Acidimicrobiales bacterium]
MAPGSTRHLLELIGIALDEFEDAPLAASLRRGWRIARLRGDLLEAFRFSMELGIDDYFEDIQPSIKVSIIREDAQALLTQRRYSDIEPRLLGLDRIEEITMQPIANLVIEPPLHEGELSLRSQIENENKRRLAASVLDRVRNDLFLYLMRCESSLRLSAAGEHIFDRHRQRVEEVLRSVAPEVLDMLTSAIGRALDVDDAESRTHALSSCRRVLEAVADVVFPPQDEPYTTRGGGDLSVQQNQHRNRTTAAIDRAGPTTKRRALTASIDEFWTRLTRLGELTNKGVHEAPTSEDVDFGVIQTYLLAGEVLSIADESASAEGA